MSDVDTDPYAEARYMADISNRMRVPDRIMVSNGAETSPSHPLDRGHKVNDLGMRQRDPRVDMQVPDRILVAGGESHIASKSTPRELQLDNAILPPTVEDVRVNTPPRSIRLDEVSYPTATDDDSESMGSISTPRRGGRGSRMNQRPSSDTTTADVSEYRPDSNSLVLDNFGARDNLTLIEEVQLMRRQMAKMNHRLMSVELENQQQQQREMILTVLVSAYFLGKIIMWINRSL